MVHCREPTTVDREPALDAWWIIAVRNSGGMEVVSQGLFAELE
jgi:hypothetical protein